MDLYCETLDRNIGSVSVDNVDSFETSSNGNDFNSVIVESEMDRAEQASVTRVKGRLRENIAFWQFIGASQWLLRVLNESCCLPFIEFPKRMFFRNHNSVFRNSEFVSSEISKLLLSGAMVEVSSTDLYVRNPLGVAVNTSGKPRLILDLRYVNQHLRSLKFKYEDIRTAADLFQKGDFF